MLLLAKRQNIAPLRTSIAWMFRHWKEYISITKKYIKAPEVAGILKLRIAYSPSTGYSSHASLQDHYYEQIGTRWRGTRFYAYLHCCFRRNQQCHRSCLLQDAYSSVTATDLTMGRKTDACARSTGSFQASDHSDHKSFSETRRRQMNVAHLQVSHFSIAVWLCRRKHFCVGKTWFFQASGYSDHTTYDHWHHCGGFFSAWTSVGRKRNGAKWVGSRTSEICHVTVVCDQRDLRSQHAFPVTSGVVWQHHVWLITATAAQARSFNLLVVRLFWFKTFAWCLHPVRCI